MGMCHCRLLWIRSIKKHLNSRRKQGLNVALVIIYKVYPPLKYCRRIYNNRSFTFLLLNPLTSALLNMICVLGQLLELLFGT